MKKYLFIPFSLLLLHLSGYSQNNELRYEILLNSGMLKDSLLTGSLSGCLDISPQSYIVLSNGSGMYLLGWGGVEAIGKKSRQPISGFAYTSEGLLLTVQNRELCFINEEGNWETLVQLPSSNMSVTAGKEVIYLYDNDQAHGKYNAYVLAKGGKYKYLLTSPGPINGICESRDSLYIAIESGIFQYSPQTGKLSPTVALERGMIITSVSADPVNEIIYFSTQAAIYAYRKHSLVLLTREFPGSVVRYFGNGLLIFNPALKDILRIVNVGSSIEF